LPIDEKIDELRRRKAGVLEERLALEAMGAIPEEHSSVVDIDREALALLGDNDAKVVPAPARATANARLYELCRLMLTLDRALERAGQIHVVDHAARSRELVAEYADQWADVQRRRANIVLSLLKANREAENLKKAMTSGGQFTGVPLDGFTMRLLGLGPLSRRRNCSIDVRLDIVKIFRVNQARRRGGFQIFVCPVIHWRRRGHQAGTEFRNTSNFGTAPAMLTIGSMFLLLVPLKPLP
jgi:hypothetical protein